MRRLISLVLVLYALAAPAFAETSPPAHAAALGIAEQDLAASRQGEVLLAQSGCRGNCSSRRGYCLSSCRSGDRQCRAICNDLYQSCLSSCRR